MEIIKWIISPCDVEVESANLVECLPMVRETGVQSQVKSYGRKKKKMVLDASLLNKAL